jgi:L-rhamnose-H+ transport protein
MATLFIVSTIGYGIGATNMGSLGPVIGWPVYVSSLLLGNSFWGWCTGEWRGAPGRAVVAMLSGIALQMAGIMFLFLVDASPPP